MTGWPGRAGGGVEHVRIIALFEYSFPRPPVRGDMSKNQKTFRLFQKENKKQKRSLFIKRSILMNRAQ